MASRQFGGLIKQQSPFLTLLFVNMVMLALWRRDVHMKDISWPSGSHCSVVEQRLAEQFTFGTTHERQHRHHHIAEAKQPNSTEERIPSIALAPKPSLATASCEVCIATPDDPLCEYGIDNIRMSRTYQGSGFRVRRMLARAEAGLPIRIGIIGGSVSAGRGVIGRDKWSQRFVKQFRRDFPRSEVELFDGAVPAMGSSFFTWCYDAMMPSDLDLYIIEMDINNESGPDTIIDDDTLFRELLGLPQQPAVIRAAVVATSFPTMMLGSVSGGLNSQWFDVPVISLRNWLLPHFFAAPEKMDEFFSRMPDDPNVIDYRHMSWIGHNALADMLTLYLREQTCEMKRRKEVSLPAAKGRWPKEDLLGKVPRLSVWEPFSNDKQPRPVTPSCAFMGGHRNVLKAYPELTDASWHVERWNGKEAMASHEVGARISFKFTGSRVGVFIYQSMGNGHPEKPGRIGCWVDGQVHDSTVLDAHIRDGPSGSILQLVKQDLSHDDHILTCQILEETSTGGHEVRFVGVASQ